MLVGLADGMGAAPARWPRTTIAIARRINVPPIHCTALSRSPIVSIFRAPHGKWTQINGRYLQPQLVELALPQHDAFSDGAQHDDCSVGEQQAELLEVEGAVACFDLVLSMVVLLIQVWLR